MTVQHQTLGVGVVGASAFATFCLDSIRPLDRLRVVGVYNRTHAKARSLAARYEATAFDSLHDLCADPAVDLVYVATTPALHKDHALPALQAGKHVLVEKPLATTLADADALLEAARASGVRLGVNFMMRYGPGLPALRTIVKESLLGDLLRGQLFNCAGDGGLPPEHWFWDESVSGGIFVEHGVHFFDLARSLFGEGAVMAAAKIRRPGYPLMDQAQCQVRYGEQSMIGFYHGFHQASPLDRQEWKLIFERGEIAMSGWIISALHVRALLEDAAIEQIQNLLPNADLTILNRYTGDARRIARRGRIETADALLRLDWTGGGNAQGRYRDALRDLMDDFAAGVEGQATRVCPSGDDGRAALSVAVDAERLAPEAGP